MSDPFASLRSTLLASPLGETITYTRSWGEALTLRVLVGTRRDVAFLDNVQVRDDTLEFEVSKDDLSDPARGDEVTRNGRLYRVTRVESDTHELFWRLTAEPGESRCGS